MFTSRAEYRLLLRQDDADIRRYRTGYAIGLANQKPVRPTATRKKAGCTYPIPQKHVPLNRMKINDFLTSKVIL